MHIIITAGGTSEAIDPVRHISNSSTGSLATWIHKAWIDYGQQHDQPLTVHYILAKDAIQPTLNDNTILYEITNTESVKTAIEQVLRKYPIDVMVHLMAISDYTVASALSLSQLTKGLVKHIKMAMAQEKPLDEGTIQDLLLGDDLFTQHDTDVKIPSKEEVFLKLGKTPKVIQMVKSISPQTRLVGFKLLNDVSEDQLIEAANHQGMTSDCEFVVANDLSKIKGQKHQALFVKNGLVFNRCSTKESIAIAIVKTLMT